MARTNVRTRKAAPRTHEGARAVRIDALAQLRRSVLSCLLWEGEFYESGEQIADRIARLTDEIAQTPGGMEDVAELAVEARHDMHLRHVPLWLVRCMAPHGGSIVGDTLAHVIQRPDEMAEFLALYWKDGKTPLSAQVKRGLARAFAKFDAYQLAKYNRDRDITLRDVMFLVHPQPESAEQAAVWSRLADGVLESPDTWEVALSGGADKRATWERLLSERKLGGLALLRNLRNMQQAGVDRSMIRAALNDHPFPRVLPFRFIAAAQHAPDFEPELEDAMFRAARELEPLGGRTVLLVDRSSSMKQRLSVRSEMSRFDAAVGLAIMLREVCDEVHVFGFASECVKVPPRRGFALRDAIIHNVRPDWTLLGKAQRYVDTMLGDYDRIIVITDEQSHDEPYRPIAPGYVINVASNANGIGYGAWTHIDGWSEQVVRYIAAMESEFPVPLEA